MSKAIFATCQIFGPDHGLLSFFDSLTNTFHNDLGQTLSSFDPLTNTFHDASGSPILSIENI
ncbi:MAG TPA: hypothetical protein VGJ73_18895 [Verrucomicrobiae bacterium]|jgi:hypothetical protein